MAFVPNLLKGIGSFAVITGVSDAFVGIRMLEAVAGESLPVTSAALAITDSQIRYLGSAWAGFGAVMWWASNDISSRRTPLALLLGALFLGGIGRSLSILFYGHAIPLFVGFIGFELLGPPAIWMALGGSAPPVKSQ